VDDEPPLNRWGRVIAPADGAGAYLMIEIEASEDRMKPPSADAIRVWQRRPGVPDDDDYNWTTWLHRPDLDDWMVEKGYVIDEWSPEGVEPDWTGA
jgi:hypothetical protein